MLLELLEYSTVRIKQQMIGFEVEHFHVVCLIHFMTFDLHGMVTVFNNLHPLRSRLYMNLVVQLMHGCRMLTLWMMHFSLCRTKLFGVS